MRGMSSAANMRGNAAPVLRGLAEEVFMPTRRGERNGRCSICSSEQRYKVELAMCAGVGRRAIANRFGVSADAAWRHFRHHVSEERRAQLIAGPVKLAELALKAGEEGLSLLEYLALVRSTLLEQFLTAGEAGDRNGLSAVAGRLLECLRIIAQLTGELAKTTATINNNTLVMASPLMADLQSMLIRTLAPYPEARAAVLCGLEELSARALAQGSAPALLEGAARA
jgi:hypothetical protein